MANLTTRRSLLKTGLLACAAGTLPRMAHAAPEFQFKYGNSSPEAHPLNIRMREAAERIKQQSNGRVELQVFPNGQLGSDTDMLSQMRGRSLDFVTLSSVLLASLVPIAGIAGIGFAWDSYDKIWSAMDGELGTHIRQGITKADIYAFEKPFENGYRHITSSTKPIQGPDDLKGFKIRVPPAPLWTSMFKAFGSVPVTMNFNEVYAAMQTKLVEGHENTLPNIYFTKIYEVQKYVSLSRHMWDPYWMMTSRRNWDGLPADIRELLVRNLTEAAYRQREDIRRDDESIVGNLAKNGIQIVQVEAAEFQKALKNAGFYKEWQGKFGTESWDILEKYTGPIG